jgi:hypothetical protein
MSGVGEFDPAVDGDSVVLRYGGTSGLDEISTFRNGVVHLRW